MDYNILKGDCLELMKDIPDGSVDMSAFSTEEIKAMLDEEV